MLRRRLLWLLSRRSRRASAGAMLSALPPSPSILLIRPDRIGDAIITTPTIQLLRQRFPDAKIGLLLGAKNAAVAELMPEINRTHLLPVSAAGALKVMGQIRGEGYDVAINLVANDSASAAAIAAASGAKWKIGFAGESSNIYDVAIPRPTGPMHIVRETSLLLAPFGIPPIGPQPSGDHERLRVRLKTEAKVGTMVVLNISGSEPSKYWGTEQFVGLGRLLGVLGMQVAVACKPSDGALAEHIANKAEVQLIPSTPSFAQFAEYLADQAGMIVTPDTSIVHLSAALGKRTVVLAADANSIAAWQPWGVPFRVVDGKGELAAITPQSVLKPIFELLMP